jgi:hypothetical protein
MGILHGLSILHSNSMSPGISFENSLVVHENRARLLWFDPFPSRFHPSEDFYQLGSWVHKHGQWDSNSVPALIEEWGHSPPPSIHDAMQLAAMAMRERLGDFASDFRKKGTEYYKKNQRINLMSLSGELQQFPPELDLKLNDGRRIHVKNKTLILEEADGEERVVFCPRQGLNTQHQRIVRSICLKAEGDCPPKKKSSWTNLRRWLQLSMQLKRLNNMLRYQLQQLR